MSNIYIKEPPTCGKVLVHTSMGDLDFELWSKEAPLACRNFVQLAMEGYYDKLTFHRVVKNFMVQGGDPTGTGEGGESIYGKPFKDEFHSRLRFVRRGLVAMANAGPNDNGSQFFITLGPCNDLNKKHTIFAKIAGDTIYNLVKLGDLETDDNEHPFNPPVIKWCKVLANPFDDIEVRENKKKKKGEKRKNERAVKATKDFKLLSFGDEAMEDEQENLVFESSAPKKSKSRHDVADDPKLSSQTLEDLPAQHDDNDKTIVEDESQNKQDNLDMIRDKLISKKMKNKKLEVDSTVKETKEDAIKKLQRESKRVAKEILKAQKDKEKEALNEPTTNDSDTDEKEEDAGDSVYGQYRQQVKAFKKKNKEKKFKDDKANDTSSRLESFRLKIQKAKMIADGEDDTAMDNNDESNSLKKDLWISKPFKSEEDELHGAKDMNRDVNEDRFDIFDPRNPMNKRKREKSHKDKKNRK